ncbi:hypothetical protein F6R98_12475 [Candidatus Methylospira mobilis]|uniref:Uncharacterized protein n=1 Tax=Candidatus Methylospira mobilis TaxID=1808979 RepID=A0A5Q0BMI0_9GAMM|nr:hypothetical protein [Candidatus Methylospira mobilis]QFY43328.1 hypothetical protein F6R98_12475 [Candidatus Methylospira mobilis]
MLTITANAREQVYKIKSAFSAVIPEWQQLLQSVSHIGGRMRFSRFPPSDSTNVNLQILGDRRLRMVLAGLIQTGKRRVLIAGQAR